MTHLDPRNTAQSLLEIADEEDGWLEDDFTPQQRWAITNLHLASIAHALLALSEDAIETVKETNQ